MGSHIILNNHNVNYESFFTAWDSFEKTCENKKSTICEVSCEEEISDGNRKHLRATLENKI
jgi:hypothetical protein